MRRLIIIIINDVYYQTQSSTWRIIELRNYGRFIIILINHARVFLFLLLDERSRSSMTTIEIDGIGAYR